MLTLENCLSSFIDYSIAHVALAAYLFVITDAWGWRMLKKLPALMLSVVGDFTGSRYVCTPS